MNRKQFTLLLVLVVVLGGAGLVLYKRDNASWKSGGGATGQKLLGNFPINDVARITVKQGPNELNLIKKEDLWSVRERNDYPANYQEIREFLLKVGDLKIVQSEPIGPTQLPRLQLAAGQGTNSATVVEFKDQNEKMIKTLLLGKMHLKKSARASEMDPENAGFPDGRYVMLSGVDTVATISDPLSNIEPRPQDWLNKVFFKVEKPRSIAVAFPAATNSWKLVRDSETNEWKLANPKKGEELDSSKIAGVTSPFNAPNFNDVIVGGKAGLEKPTTVAIETFDNFTYTIKVGQMTNEGYPMMIAVAGQFAKTRVPGKDEKPEDKTKLDKEFADTQRKLEGKLVQEKVFEKWVYLVSNWTVDPVLKERSQLLAEKKEEPKKEEPKKEEPKKEEKPARGSTIPRPRR